MHLGHLVCLVLHFHSCNSGNPPPLPDDAITGALPAPAPVPAPAPAPSPIPIPAAPVILPAAPIPRKDGRTLPVDIPFQYPSPLPTWPKGGGFATGMIDLGGLEVHQVSNLSRVWSVLEGGPDDQGVSFFEPSSKSFPDGFFMLGSYSQPNSSPFFGRILVARDLSSDKSILKIPTDYTLVWSSESLNIKQEGVGYIWLPIPPANYTALGHVVTTTPEKPRLDKIRCVRSDFSEPVENGDWLWSSNGINIHSPRPVNRGVKALGVSTGTFVVVFENRTMVPSACLKNVAANLTAMPNLEQIEALIKEYSPQFYFHPDEHFLPASVNWLFQNGAMLYTKGQEGSPVPISLNGMNLPQFGENDGTHWIDLPSNEAEKERVKQGSLPNATVYLHAKPMLGATFTDICVWLFYPFNGGAKVKLDKMTVDLGKIGEHVGDFEHITLRISNFNGELMKVYFSQHNTGAWMYASGLDFEKGNKPAFYSSLNGHAAFPKQGLFLQGIGKVGIKNACGRGAVFLDAAANYTVISAAHLGNEVAEPPWLNYAREWGPRKSYDLGSALGKMRKALPGMFKHAVDDILQGLPKEVLGEEGPTGPKWKDNWDGDERCE